MKLNNKQLLCFVRLRQKDTKILVNKLNSNSIFQMTNNNIDSNSNLFTRACVEKKAIEQVSEKDPKIIIRESKV